MQQVSGSTINDISGAATEELKVAAVDPQLPDAPADPPRPSLFSKLLTAQTGAGSIESYMDHPMNFNKGMGLAQMIRGATGLFGSLDLAIIDIIIGGLEYFRSKKPAVSPDLPPLYKAGVSQNAAI